MIPRYAPEDVAALWTDAHRLRTWLGVELAVTAVLAERGLIPEGDQRELERVAAGVDYERLAADALEIERTTHHDVIAFLTAFEAIAGPPARHVHYGLTSSDVVDTAFALVLGQALDLVLRDLDVVLAKIKARAEGHRRTLMVGRTHGIHAEPITFGFVLAGWYAELRRSRVRLVRAREGIRTGKLSGAVGTSAHLPPEIEPLALGRIGLTAEPIATQVVPRDRHAEVFSALAILGSSIERAAVEIRHLQRTEVLEAEEPFAKGQKGSSAMPHKRNPILSENLTGLARLLRSYAQASLENIALWHERDISHSSVERVIAPDATILACFMLRRLERLVDGLVVYPANMLKNLERMRGLVFSQAVLLRLAEKGLARQAAYELVQRSAMRVWAEDIDLKSALSADPELTQHLGPAELEACFDPERYFRAIDLIIDRAFGSA